MKPRFIFLTLPFAIWIGLLFVLPPTAWAYALRTALTALALVVALAGTARRTPLDWRVSGRTSLVGLVAGLIVMGLWITPGLNFRFDVMSFSFLPETSEGAYAPETCGWALTLVKLAGSAFVISAAEELFFRVWLLEFAGFGWMVALFAVEHDRPLVAALCGVIYGVCRIRWGLFSAVVAHAVTNLTLGLYVILFDRWQYW